MYLPGQVTEQTKDFETPAHGSRKNALFTLEKH